MARLQTQLAWRRSGEALQIQGTGLRFANADAEGEAEFVGEPAASPLAARAPIPACSISRAGCLAQCHPGALPATGNPGLGAAPRPRCV